MVFHNKNPKYSQKMENSCTQGNNNRSTLVTMSKGSAHLWPLLHLLTALLFLNTRADLPNDEVLTTTCLWPPLLQTPMRNRLHSWAEAAQERWLTRGLNTFLWLLRWLSGYQCLTALWLSLTPRPDCREKVAPWPPRQYINICACAHTHTNNFFKPYLRLAQSHTSKLKKIPFLCLC